MNFIISTHYCIVALFCQYKSLIISLFANKGHLGSTEVKVYKQHFKLYNSSGVPCMNFILSGTVHCPNNGCWPQISQVSFSTEKYHLISVFNPLPQRKRKTFRMNQPNSPVSLSLFRYRMQDIPGDFIRLNHQTTLNTWQERNYPQMVSQASISAIQSNLQSLQEVPGKIS